LAASTTASTRLRLPAILLSHAAGTLKACWLAAVGLVEETSTDETAVAGLAVFVILQEP
jgi:hypothetical protein